MSASETRYEHIQIDEKGIAYIKNSTTKVIELISEQLSYGWSPEEIHFQHPYLSLAQIYSALAFYWDNKNTIDLDLTRRKEKIASLQSTASKLLQKKLRSKKAG
jgi:uncharacterized protein (DUF433 family)